jgi:hypothetical protein
LREGERKRKRKKKKRLMSPKARKESFVPLETEEEKRERQANLLKNLFGVTDQYIESALPKPQNSQQGPFSDSADHTEQSQTKPATKKK